MQTDTEVAVIGAGAVGLAIAQAVAKTGHEVLVLERNKAVGQETSSRNSEVIHAGLYYPPGSLKGRLCVAGKIALYRFAQENGVAFQRMGKLIVATSAAEETRLSQILCSAESNGVFDLRSLGPADLKSVEPEISATAALLSPSTGIIDSHGYMVALEGHLTTHNGSVVLNTTVTGIRLEADGVFTLHVTSGELNDTLTARQLVLAAGHGMPDLASKLPVKKPYKAPKFFRAKGHYFTLRRAVPFSHLIYPTPVDGGLGIHLTLDLQGRAKFGPDVQWLDTIDYRFDDPDDQRRSAFAKSIQRYWPNITANDLDQGYTGIRPKLSGPGEPASDFRIDGPHDHGIPGMVCLYGIESPGLTASLAIGDWVAELLTADANRLSAS